MNNIDSYIIKNRKTSFIINLFLFVSLILFISLILILNIKYKKYYHTFGQVINNNNNYNLNIYLSPSKLFIIKNNNSIIIDDLRYNYNIKSISSDYLINDNFNNYIEVVLEIELNDKDKINNNILEIKILENDKKLFYYLKEYIEEGVKK